MQVYKVIITPLAENNLTTTALYIGICLRNTQAANNTILKIKERINSLNVFPKAYPLIDERKEIRKVTVDNHNISYKVYDSRKTVHIISVIHSKMNQQAELRKLSDSE